MKIIARFINNWYWDIMLFMALVIIPYLLRNQTSISWWNYLFIESVLLIAFILILLLRHRAGTIDEKFPKKLVKKIEDQTPHQSLALTDGFQQELDRCHEALSKKLKSNELQSACNNIASFIAGYLNKLPKEHMYQSLENMHIDNSIICLCFYVGLIQAIKDFAPTSALKKKISPYRWVFDVIDISWTKQHLFREYYRLFEISLLLNGKTNDVHFNADIKAILAPAFGVDTTTPPRKLKAVVKKNIKREPIKTIVAKQNTTPKKDVHKSVAPEDNNNQNDTKENFQGDNATDDNNKTNTLNIKKFKKWMAREIDPAIINTKSYFYKDDELLSDEFILITDGGLIDFAEHINGTLESVKALLLEKDLSLPNKYYLKISNEPNVYMTAVKFTRKMTDYKENNHKIEVSP